MRLPASRRQLNRVTPFVAFHLGAEPAQPGHVKVDRPRPDRIAADGRDLRLADPLQQRRDENHATPILRADVHRDAPVGERLRVDFEGGGIQPAPAYAEGAADAEGQLHLADARHVLDHAALDAEERCDNQFRRGVLGPGEGELANERLAALDHVRPIVRRLPRDRRRRR